MKVSDDDTILLARTIAKVQGLSSADIQTRFEWSEQYLSEQIEFCRNLGIDLQSRPQRGGGYYWFIANESDLG